MEQLQELARIVSRKKLMKLTILGQTDSKLDEYYRLIADGQVRSDDEAARLLYEQDASYKPYQKLKYKLKQRLVDTLFIIDNNKPINQIAGRAYETAWRMWAGANIMFGNGAERTGIEWAEKVIKLATQYEFTDLLVNACKVLRKYYATRLGDEEQFNYYHELLQRHQAALQDEILVEEYYERIMLVSIRSKANKQEIIEKGKAYYEQLAHLLDKHDTFAIHRFLRYIRVSYLLNDGQYEAAIEACQKAIDFFNQKPFVVVNTTLSFLLNQIMCYTQLKNYAEGRKKIEICQDIIEEEGVNYTWFKLQEMALILALHSREYQAAYRALRQTIDQPSFPRQDVYTQETWNIYKAYVHYLIYLGTIEPEPEDPHFTRFQMGKFLNEVPVFSKDKRGMNIPILIIHILFTVALGRYDEALDRMEAIEKYTTRYIRNDEHFRSNCFIKMLLQIPVGGFHRKAAERYAGRYQKRLLSQPLEIANQAYEIEIIPYEDLWQMALVSLHRKRVKVKGMDRFS